MCRMRIVPPRASAPWRVGLRSSWWLRGVVVALLCALWGTSARASAAPAVDVPVAVRNEIRAAYLDAMTKFTDLELDAALSIVDRAVDRASQTGLRDDAMLGPLFALRGGILYMSTGAINSAQTAIEEAVRLDYFVQLPIELRSRELQRVLEQARARRRPRSLEPILHQTPTYKPQAAVDFVAVVNFEVPDGAKLAMYWRIAGTDAAPEALFLTELGNVGWASLPAEQHGGKGVEYFFYVWDSAQSDAKPLANRGDENRSLYVGPQQTRPVPVTTPGKAADQPSNKDRNKDRKKRRKLGGSAGPTTLPRAWINVGVGTGFGLARGRAELTYEQYTPGIPQAYNVAEQACAIERWYAGTGPLARTPDEFGQHLDVLNNAIGPKAFPTGVSASDLVAQYQPGACARRHPVQTGLSLAPLHLAPDVTVRVSKRVALSLFARLQVVTGSQVYGQRPITSTDERARQEAFNADARSQQPPGFRTKPPFTWAIGAKVKYFFLPDDWKFRLYTGGMAGYGQSRLRVPMGFANDRNGNSVPDVQEAGVTGDAFDANGNVTTNPRPVWPYNDGVQSESDRTLAKQVTSATSATDQRIDTVVIGPGFVGGLFGFNYQIHQNFAVFTEIAVGVWFPRTTSFLFDLTVGPAVTF